MSIDVKSSPEPPATDPAVVGTPLTLPVDADVLGREIHRHLTPEHSVLGCVLCETQVPSTFFIQLKACCGTLETDECDCGPGEFSAVFDRPIMWDLRGAA